MFAPFDTNKTLDDLLHSFLDAALVTVGAPAGSVMMLDRTREELHVKARLGPPRGRTNEPVFAVGIGSIAGKVAKDGVSYICPDVSSDKVFLHRSDSLHFTSLLCVPIKDSNQVYGVVNADHPEASKFTEEHKEALEALCRNLVPYISGRITLPEALSKSIRRFMEDASDNEIERTLQGMADDIKNVLGADVVILYQYDHDLDQFVLTKDGTPTISGEVKLEYMGTPVQKTDGPYKILERGQPVFIPSIAATTELAQNLKRPIIRKGEPNPERPRFCVREKIKSMAALPLIHRSTHSDEGAFVGVLFVNYRRQHQFNTDEESSLQTFADTAAFAILSARTEERNRKEKTGLYHRVTERAHRLLDGNSDESKRFLRHFKSHESQSFVMAIDIRRSTDLMYYASDAWMFVEFISAVENALKAVVKRNWGIVDKFTGDGLIAHFPVFYAGDDAGGHCLNAAAECHKEFEAIYAAKSDCFDLIRGDVGLGIGIDYGLVHLAMEGQELIAVGRPLVWACRLSAVECGHTALNQQATRAIKDKYLNDIHLDPHSLEVKHVGEVHVTRVRLPLGQLPVTDPTL